MTRVAAWLSKSGDDGQTMSEYAVVLSVITAAAIAAYAALSQTVIDLAQSALERMP